MNTSDLISLALDWAVAKCVGRGYPYPASTDWSVGGPIIEREIYCLQHLQMGEGYEWVAVGVEVSAYGPTALVAAMRCYVASKLGDEVNIPELLCTPAT